MATVLSTPVQRVILRNISWTTYERLLAEHVETSSTHFTYDRGLLEIIVLSAGHEALKHTLEVVVEVVAEESGVDVYGIGSTTVHREDLARGFEPDACFYIQREALVRGKDELDLHVDPPPDLVIEIDITHPSLDAFPLFAALGIPEVWRYDGTRVTISTLGEGEYLNVAVSYVLPGVTSTALSQFVDTSKHLRYTVWLRQVREWVRAQDITGLKSPE